MGNSHTKNAAKGIHYVDPAGLTPERICTIAVLHEGTPGEGTGPPVKTTKTECAEQATMLPPATLNACNI